MEVLRGEVSHKLGYGFWAVVVKGIFGGWLVALVVWTVAASRDTVSQVLFVYVLVFLIPAAGLTHCVAGSAEVLMSVFSEAISSATTSAAPSHRPRWAIPWASSSSRSSTTRRWWGPAKDPARGVHRRREGA